MVKYSINYLLIFSLSLILLGCHTANDIKSRFEKKIENFNSSDFPEIQFEKLYVLEGVYYTKKDFELIYPKILGTDGHTKFLYLYKDGKPLFLLR